VNSASVGFLEFFIFEDEVIYYFGDLFGIDLLINLYVYSYCILY